MNVYRCLIASLAIVFSSILSVSAQTYQPKEKWPYIYQEFQEGGLLSTTGDNQKSLYNIPVTGKSIHYVSDGVVMELPIAKVSAVTIGDDTYVCKAGYVYKVLAQDDNGYVLYLTLPDYDKMTKADIGYGISSSTASVQNISVLMEDSSTDLLNKRYETLTDRFGQGKDIPLRSTYHIFVNGMVIDANQSDIVKITGIDKSTVSKFVKENKVKWKDAASLMSLVDFIVSQK